MQSKSGKHRRALGCAGKQVNAASNMEVFRVSHTRSEKQTQRRRQTAANEDTGKCGIRRKLGGKQKQTPLTIVRSIAECAVFLACGDRADLGWNKYHTSGIYGIPALLPVTSDGTQIPK